MIKKQLYAIVLFSLLILVGCDVSGDDASTFASSPSLKTLSISNITHTSATVGGFIINDGGKTLIEKGIAWDTLANPTIFNSKLHQEGEMEQYSLNLTDLVPSTVYYVRAYAINEIGISYGNQISFTTLDVPTIYEIGDIGPAGGYVFQVDESGLHGKEIAPLSTQFESQWGCPIADISGTLAAVGTGQANSTLILEYHDSINYYTNPDQCTNIIIANGDVAAKYCADLSFNGFEDWYLPSIGELELVYTNLISQNLGDITDSPLSSSTQDPTDNQKHMILIPENGDTGGLDKNNSNYYRAVRDF